METHEFGTVLCLFSISRAGFSSVARKPLRSVRVNGVGSHEIGPGFNSRRRSHVSRAIHYFIPSLVALGRGLLSTHENRVSVV